MSLLRRAEALDIGDGASGLLVPRAALQDCPSVRGPSRGGTGGAVVGLGGGLGVCSLRPRADGEGMSTSPFIIKKVV